MLKTTHKDLTCLGGGQPWVGFDESRDRHSASSCSVTCQLEFCDHEDGDGDHDDDHDAGEHDQLPHLPTREFQPHSQLLPLKVTRAPGSRKF